MCVLEDRFLCLPGNRLKVVSTANALSFVPRVVECNKEEGDVEGRECLLARGARTGAAAEGVRQGV